MTHRLVNRVAVLASVVVVMASAPLHAATPEIPYSNTLTITSPSDGTVTAPGDTLPVEVTAASGVTMDVVGLTMADVGLFSPLSTSPYVFQVPIPSNIIGPRKVTALGKTSDGTPISSYPITVDIETSAAIMGLSVSPRKMYFQYAGQQLPLDVTGTFSGGGQLDITRSSKITYTSQDPSVATVSPTGEVTATGVGSTGSTVIMVTYDGQSVGIPVSVKSAVRGDLNGDGRVDRDDLNVLMSWLNTPATTTDDARDLNHDGVINALDARILVTLCTNPGCAP